jgi:hypothetical protein
MVTAEAASMGVDGGISRAGEGRQNVDAWERLVSSQVCLPIFL